MGFPLATLLINIIGSTAMGIFVGLMARLLPTWQEDARLFVAVGILGGFTTFSSFSLDAIVLMERGEWLAAGAYVLLSVVLYAPGLLVFIYARRTHDIASLLKRRERVLIGLLLIAAVPATWKLMG